jgi:DNA-binding PadR family transcriptional regulator
MTIHGQLLLLGLVRERARHGYDLVEYVERAMSSCIELKRPTAYFLLDKMAQAGWLESVSERSGRRPARRVYRLTAAGEEEFQRLLRENLREFDGGVFPGDIGLTFVDSLPRPEALELLAQRRAALRRRQAAVDAAPPHPGALQWTIEHARRHLQTELQWLDEVMAALATHVPTGDANRVVQRGDVASSFNNSQFEK